MELEHRVDSVGTGNDLRRNLVLSIKLKEQKKKKEIEIDRVNHLCFIRDIIYGI